MTSRTTWGKVFWIEKVVLPKTFTENWVGKQSWLFWYWYLFTLGLENSFLEIKLFCFSRYKAETFNICLKLSFMKPLKILTRSAYSDKFNFHFLYGLSDWVEILWGFTKFFYKQMLKVSAFYLEKQPSFIPKKISSRCQG